MNNGDTNMYMEYDWAFGCYRFRFGDRFIDVRDYRSASSKEEAEWILSTAGLKLGRKTDSRTWAIVAA
jgi:hypothetical protein